MRHLPRSFSTTSSKYLVFKSIPLKTGENHISWISTTDCYLPTTPRGEIIQWALPCIWHTSKPLLSASTTLSSLIVTFIHTDEFRLRLDSVGLNAVDLPVWLHIRDTNPAFAFNLQHVNLDVETRHMFIFELVLDAIDRLGSMSMMDEDNPQIMIVWVPETQTNFPVPYFPSLPSEWSQTDAAAMLQILRYVGPYEGGIDYAFERRIKSSIALLFKEYGVAFIQGTDCGAQQFTTFPLIIAGGQSEFGVDVQLRMAQLAEPTLIQILRKHGDSDKPLPKFCFIFGLHWDRYYLSIYIHLPCRVEFAGYPQGDCHYEFRQCFVSRFRLTVWNNEPIMSQDERLIDRWTLLTTLLTIRAHVCQLRGWLALTNQTQQGNKHRSTQVSQPGPDNRLKAVFINLEPHLTKRFSQMREYWRGDAIELPADWIPLDNCVIAPMRDERWLMDMVATDTQHFISVLLYPIRHLLRPVMRDKLLPNHCDDKYLGPDFLVVSHLPRRNPYYGGLEVEREYESAFLQLNRLYDILCMATASWDDINLFISSVFSSLAKHSVLWNPVIRYPFEVEEIESPDVVVDFVLAIQHIPASTEITTKRAPLLPLTISTPVVLLGLRASTMDENESNLMESEVAQIKALARPHLELLMMYVRHQNGCYSNPSDTFIPFWAVLFTTYLKAGRLHILALCPTDIGDDFAILVHLIDTLPVEQVCKTDGHILNRLRLGIALFTLQRNVALASIHLRCVWPPELLIEEHEAIAEVTGISTPNPSIDVELEEGVTEKKRKWLLERMAEDSYDDDNSEDSSDSERYAATFGSAHCPGDHVEAQDRVKRWLEHSPPSYEVFQDVAFGDGITPLVTDKASASCTL